MNQMETRARIVKALKTKPMTMREIADFVDLEYESVRYHVRALQPQLKVTKVIRMDHRMLPKGFNQYEYKVNT